MLTRSIPVEVKVSGEVSHLNIRHKYNGNNKSCLRNKSSRSDNDFHEIFISDDEARFYEFLESVYGEAPQVDVPQVRISWMSKNNSRRRSKLNLIHSNPWIYC